MSSNFTHWADESIWDFEDPAEAIAFLNNPENFRTFSDGLTELMRLCGYSGPDTPEAKSTYLTARLDSIGAGITDSTVQSWFAENQTPIRTSRTKMYQVCFSLGADIDGVKWFFHHVYFDRSFNCHTILEAVYYYCFRNHLPYAKAVELIRLIDEMPADTSSGEVENVFTNEILERLGHIGSEAELLNFFQENKPIFSSWNHTASVRISWLLSEIHGKPSDQEAVNQCKKGLPVSKQTLEGCSLVIQEYLYNIEHGLLDYGIAHKNISSRDFMLIRILNTASGLDKHIILPKAVKTNFPRKQRLSDLVNKPETLKSYDSIRKLLILLKFYHFWCFQLLHPAEEGCDLFDLYRDESNALLTECGYEELYPGNPYDWLFLWAATGEAPLTSLRAALDSLEYTE